MATPDGSPDPVEQVFADLEQQAQGLHLRERDDEVAGLLPAEYAHVDLEARLHGSIGRRVAVRSATGLRVEGVLDQAGRGWFGVDAGARTWLLLTSAVLGVSGLGERALIENARSVAARLGPGAPLRDLADRRDACVSWLADGSRVEGVVRRVGADFVEIQARPARQVVPFAALVAVAADAPEEISRRGRPR